MVCTELRVRGGSVNRKLHKDDTFPFGDLHENELSTLATLQKTKATPPFIALPRAEWNATGDTDSCDNPMECVLLHKQPNCTSKLIGFGRDPPKTRSADTTHCEDFSVVSTLVFLRPYLEGTRITIRANHESFRWILNMSYARSQQERWRFCVAKIGFEAAHRAGIKHQAVDTLSHL